MANSEPVPVLYRRGDKTAVRPDGWKEGDRFLFLPNKGSPRANWNQNDGRLREEIRKGFPIFDSYRRRDGSQIPAGQIPKSGGRFLGAERNRLEEKGWRYSPSTGAYHPPTSTNK